MSLPAAARPGASLPAALRAGRVPRFMHPVAWWAWALGLMVAASRTTQPLLLALMLAVLALVVVARRPAAAWAGAFSAALRLGVVVIVARILLQVVLGAPVGLEVAFRLPEVTLPDWMAGVRLGGVVTWGGLVLGFCEGLRLAVMIACVGAANSLSAPSRLLRSVPAALYELGVAVVVALTFAPHLLEDARRVRGARRLRGHDEGRLRSFAKSGGPVLDGGLERSIQLAAAMDSRGYGRSGDLTPRHARVQAGLILAGFAGVLVGLYGLFDSAAPRALGWPTLALGVALAAAGLQAAGRRSTRSAYRPDPWRWPEWLTVAAGLLVAAAFLATPLTRLLVPVSSPTAPGLEVLPALAVLLCAGPAAWAPPVPGLRSVAP
jgi:energy-coupling factor transport system permease protein